MSGKGARDPREPLDGIFDLLVHVGRRRPETLDDHVGDRGLREAPRVRRDDLTAERVTDQGWALELQRADQVVQIEDEVAEGIVGRRLAVAVPAQIEGQHVVAIEQTAGEIVEGVRVIAEPMHDHDRGAGIDRGSLRRGSPIAEVNPERAASEETLGVFGNWYAT